MIDILKNLDSSFREKWVKQFVGPNRQCSEGIWRRTQEERTKDLSGWTNESDARRRILHFYDEYDVISVDGRYDFVIKNIYLWLALSMPKTELDIYRQRIIDCASKNMWKIDGDSMSKEDLTLRLKSWEEHPEDKKANRKLPAGYETLELTLQSDDNFRPNASSPWAVLESGIRQKGTRVNKPNCVGSMREFFSYAPFQFELGGGASIELGIPPLNHLHGVYQVSDMTTKQFILGCDDTLILEILTDTDKFYIEKASVAYKESLLAEPNEFYLMLQDLHTNGYAVGDIITNNFDGMTSLIGLQEKYVRKYEDTDIVPEIRFDSSARALIVVGSHADRRLIQRAARENGLKVIFIDPEMYTNHLGEIVNYPLENVEQDDLLFQKTAVEFANVVRDYLKSNT